LSEWDLVVAGGGPAGCALAARVAMGGRKVLLLECGEPGAGRDWVVDVERSTFKRAGAPVPLPDETFVEPERTFLVTSDATFMVPLRQSPLLPVRNARYVKRLSGWAGENGATVRAGCRVEGPIIEGGTVRGVRFTSGKTGEEARACVTADCTGIAGTIRKKTPASWMLSDPLRPGDTVLARREIRRVDVAAARASVKSGFMLDGMRLDRTAVQGTYSIETVFLDTDNGFVDILTGVKPGSGPTADELFGEMVERFSFIGEKIFGDGAPIPIRGPLATFVADGLVVLGDSACQVIPAHGSGTASADACAPVVLHALQTGRTGRADLWGYNNDFLSRRGAVLAYYDVLRRHTESLRPEHVDQLMKNGLLGADEVYSGLLPEPARFDLRSAIARVPGAVRCRKLLKGVAASGLLAERTRRHYAQYPPVFSAGALERWMEAVPGRAR
jgi:digeranylgeranylglycerophospholipid reductase